LRVWLAVIASQRVGANVDNSSLPGLTRQSSFFEKTSCEDGWMPGSSPGMTSHERVPMTVVILRESGVSSTLRLLGSSLASLEYWIARLRGRRRLRVWLAVIASQRVAANVDNSSLPGLTRQSIFFEKTSCEDGWMPGSSPGMTSVFCVHTNLDFKQQPPFADTASRSRRMCCARFGLLVPPSQSEGAGNAGRPMHPQPRVRYG
jgi:hypothetical protein